MTSKNMPSEDDPDHIADDAALHTGTGQADAPEVDETTPMPIVDPDDEGFYFVQVMQWIALHPEITHTAYRVYTIFRSLYTHRRDVRELSRDQLRYMVPGVNGKPMGKTALNDALAVLAKLHLVSNPDGQLRVWRLRDPDTKRFVTKETKAAWKLGKLPPEGRAFRGWRNSFDKSDLYPGIGWEKSRADLAPTPPVDNSEDAGQSHDRNSGRGHVDAPPTNPEPVDNSEDAGQSHDRNSGSPDRKSDDGHRNSGQCEPVTSANPASNNQSEEQQTNNNNQGDSIPLTPSTRATPADAGVARTGNTGQVDQVVTTEPDLGSNPPHAGAQSEASPRRPEEARMVRGADSGTSGRPAETAGTATEDVPEGVDPKRWTADMGHLAKARARAGRLACTAVLTDPGIATAEVERLVLKADSTLSQGQVVGRAATLLAWESKVRLLREGPGESAGAQAAARLRARRGLGSVR